MTFDGTGVIDPLLFGRYRHYKGKYYEVIGLAHSTETGEKLVIYRGLYKSQDLADTYGPDPLFARPYAMFIGDVEVGDKVVKRFEYVGPMQ